MWLILLFLNETLFSHIGQLFSFTRICTRVQSSLSDHISWHFLRSESGQSFGSWLSMCKLQKINLVKHDVKSGLENCYFEGVQLLFTNQMCRTHVIHNGFNRDGAGSENLLGLLLFYFRVLCLWYPYRAGSVEKKKKNTDHTA